MQMCVAADGLVFVADDANDRVHEFTPTLELSRCVGEGVLEKPVGVCASADVVVVSCPFSEPIITVLDRRHGTVRLRFGARGSRDGELKSAEALCFVHGDAHIAVSDPDYGRVSVFALDGTFIRHVGVGVLKCPRGIACSAFDELVVADSTDDSECPCVHVFSESLDLPMTFGRGAFSDVAVFGSSVFAWVEDFEEGSRCIEFS
jgi:hypothetical protein